MKRSILVASLSWLMAGWLTGAVPAPERLLPQDSWAVITIPDLAQAQTQIRQWPIVKLWNEPAMKPFREKFMTKWTADVVSPLEKEFGLSFERLSKVGQGQLTFALTRTGLDEKEADPGLLIVLDSRDQKEALSSLLSDLRKKWTDSGKAVKTISLRGVEFTSLTFDPSELGSTLEKALPWLKSEDAQEEPEENGDKEKKEENTEEKKETKNVEWFIGQSDSLLLVGDHAVDVEKVLARIEGGSAPALAEQEHFAANYPLVLRDAIGYGWIDLSVVLQRVLKEAPPPSEEEAAASPLGAMTPQKFLEPLGLMGLQTLSFAVHNHSEGGLIDVLLNVPAAKRKGIFDLFRFEALDADPPAFVPADVTSFSRFRLNLRETWERAEKMLGDISPQLAGVAKMVIDTAGKDKDPNFDLRQSFIANLGNDIISYEKAPRDTSLESLAEPPSMYLIGSPRPEQLASGLKAVTSLLPVPGMLKEREFLGRTVFTFDLPQEEGESRKLHFSPSGGYVAISMDEATLEEFLRTTGSNPGNALREDRELVKAAQKVGGMSTGLFGYENQRQNMRTLVESLRKDSDSLNGLFSSSPIGEAVKSEEVKEWFDFSLLPPFERIAKYFNIEVFSGQVTDDGFRFKVYTPHPPGE